ncbi:MAG: AMP-binding protein [Sandaracinaceae bacterium]|jgi:fatty-acyl-CoA synthase|nr:AMP-binding protein [Sandaracinaceae bacterium]
MKTIVDRVDEVAANDPGRVCAELITKRGTPSVLSYGDVAVGMRRAAAYMHSKGVTKGDVVVLVGTHHRDLYAVWLGAVWLGAIPTILAEPSVRVDKQVYFDRLQALLERVQAKIFAHDPSLVLSESFAQGTTRASYSELSCHDGEPPARHAAMETDVLLLQHSSGTTGLQKGVMLSHGAVMRHNDAYTKAVGIGEDDIIASWLPLYHDMGFIACFLVPLQVGASVMWLSPFEWVASPAMLLETISSKRATLAWLPNFAFAFLAQRIRPTTTGLDLSSLRNVISCSEPVTTRNVDIFVSKLAPFGLRAASVQCCYAMAENVFAVTTTTSEDPPRRIDADFATWQTQHRVLDAVGEARSVTFISNGKAIEDTSVRISSADGSPVAAREAGRIFIRSEYMFDGYFRRDDLNATLFDAAGFYDTGDLGFIDEAGHLYVTGRLKELIIVGGRNVYALDVEDAAHLVEGVYPGRVVCFGVSLNGLDTEGLVVLVESDAPEAEWPEIGRKIRTTVAATLDLDVSDARVVSRGSLRKSTSGKLARTSNREWYLQGRFGVVPTGINSEEAQS